MNISKILKECLGIIKDFKTHEGMDWSFITLFQVHTIPWAGIGNEKMFIAHLYISCVCILPP